MEIQISYLGSAVENKCASYLFHNPFWNK